MWSSSVRYLGKEGLSPASKASLNCLTALSWPGRRKMPSSVSPCSSMNSTHFCTRMGTLRGPNLCSYVTVSIRLFPNTAIKQNDRIMCVWCDTIMMLKLSAHLLCLCGTLLWFDNLSSAACLYDQSDFKAEWQTSKVIWKSSSCCQLL